MRYGINIVPVVFLISQPMEGRTVWEMAQSKENRISRDVHNPS